MSKGERQPQERPVVGVSAAIIRDGLVLLVRRGKPPFIDVWSFPGGHVEFGERLADAAAREVLEETGIAVEIGDQIDRAEIILRDESGEVTRHYVLFVFGGRYLGGDVRAGDDAADVRWVAPGEGAQLQLTPDTRRILTKLKS